MNALKRLQWQKYRRQMAEEGRKRRQAQALFEEWQARTSALVCRAIRTYREADKAGVHYTAWRSPHWLEAALRVLESGDDEFIDEWLRAPLAEKDAICAAIIEDKGLELINGFWWEL